VNHFITHVECKGENEGDKSIYFIDNVKVKKPKGDQSIYSYIKCKGKDISHNAYVECKENDYEQWSIL
jgi:hypothetical protein